MTRFSRAGSLPFLITTRLRDDIQALAKDFGRLLDLAGQAIDLAQLEQRGEGGGLLVGRALIDVGHGVDPFEGLLDDIRLEVKEAGLVEPGRDPFDKILDGVEREGGLSRGELVVFLRVGASGDCDLLAGLGGVARVGGSFLGFAGNGWSASMRIQKPARGSPECTETPEGAAALGGTGAAGAGAAARGATGGTPPMAGATAAAGTERGAAATIGGRGGSPAAAPGAATGATGARAGGTGAAAGGAGGAAGGGTGAAGCPALIEVKRAVTAQENPRNPTTIQIAMPRIGTRSNATMMIAPTSVAAAGRTCLPTIECPMRA